MQSGQEVVSLHLDDIIPNRFQPREVFDERALKELAASIKEHGVIQPIIVRKVNNKYEIIAGERRYKASALAGMTKIPAIINNLDDKEAAKVALLENLQRKNLNPIEEARTYQKILELDQMTQESLAKTMGKSQSAVANKLRLLALPEEIQLALLKDEISERHARTLLNLKNNDEQKKLLKKIITEKMSVRKLEEEIQKINSTQEKQEQGEQMIPNINQNTETKQPNNLLFNDNPQQFNSPIFTQKKPTLMEMATSNTNEIVNYGNIDDDELDSENSNDYNFSSSKNSAIHPVNLNEMISQTMDINQMNNINNSNNTNNNNNNSSNNNNNSNNKEKISNDLDSLLNISPPKNNNNGFTMESIKNSEENNDTNSQDYFKAPELMSVQLPNSTNNNNTIMSNFENLVQDEKYNNQNKISTDRNNSGNNMSFFQNNNQVEINPKKEQKSLGRALIEEAYNIQPKEKQKEYNIQQIVQRIRETIQLLERGGAKIDTDEIDFENQYQIVIRIDKNS